MGLKFLTIAPQVDEETLKKQSSLNPQGLAEMLAFEKTNSIARDKADTITIGGDQLVVLNNKVYGKAGSPEKALEQLKEFSGKTHQLITSICVMSKNRHFIHTDITYLTMKSLTETYLQKYILENETWNCAGSYKIESSGSYLFSKIESDDESAIIGIPTKALKKILLELSS